MRKPKIIMDVMKEIKGYSAFTKIGTTSIFSQGDTFKELQNDTIEAINFALEEKKIKYRNDEIFFRFGKRMNR